MSRGAQIIVWLWLILLLGQTGSPGWGVIVFFLGFL